MDVYLRAVPVPVPLSLSLSLSLSLCLCLRPSPRLCLYADAQTPTLLAARPFLALAFPLPLSSAFARWHDNLIVS